MAYEILITDAFRDWYEGLLEAEQNSVERVVDMLAGVGPLLAYPYCSGINGSRFPHMRELRIQHQGRPYRVLYAFDPSRSAMLLVGGDKTGDDRWYDKAIPKADTLYSEHLKSLK